MNGRLIVLGGEVGYNLNQTTVYAYDPALDRWDLLATLPIKRSTSVAGVIGPNQSISSTGNGPARRRRHGSGLWSKCNLTTKPRRARSDFLTFKADRLASDATERTSASCSWSKCRFTTKPRRHEGIFLTFEADRPSERRERTNLASCSSWLRG